MYFENISLQAFRCYSNLKIRPSRGINVFHGKNGQGKTSIVEAIGYLATLKSFRAQRLSEVIQLGEKVAKISGGVVNDNVNFMMDLTMYPTRKQLSINGKACRYLSEYTGKVYSVSFSPPDVEIIRGSPELRRNWIDKVAQSQNHEHFDLLIRYTKLLDQRNRLLRDLTENRLRSLPDYFEVWTEELIKLGSKVIHNRMKTVDKVVDKIRDYYCRIALENPSITIQYCNESLGKDLSGQASDSSIEIIGRALGFRARELRRKEEILGSTLFGPHRDDVQILMGPAMAKAIASQGEVRTLVLAMRLAEVDLIKEKTLFDPVLLIDDFSSELDSNRRSFLLRYLEGSSSQVFVTTTEQLGIGKEFSVENYQVNSCDSKWSENGDRHHTNLS